MKFLLNTFTSWDEAPRARHQITSELLKLGHEVIFVEKNRLGFPRLDIRREGNLTLVTPYFIPSYKYRNRLPLINEIFQHWLVSRLKRLQKDFLVINFDFAAHVVTRRFQNTVYYCNDEFVGNSKYTNYLIDRYHGKSEAKVIRNSALCITTAAYLTAKLNQINEACYEIPLGGPDPSEIKHVEDSQGGKGITVGLVGFISIRNISHELVNSLIAEKDISVTLVGPVEESFLAKLSPLEKVFCTGVLKDQLLYDAIQKFDVAIAPYEHDRINPGTTPNKLYLYLACGVPVVITDLPNLKDMIFSHGTVYKAVNHNDFIPLIRKADNENREALKQVRRDLASDNTWAKRVDRFLEILSEKGLITRSSVSSNG